MTDIYVISYTFVIHHLDSFVAAFYYYFFKTEYVQPQENQEVLCINVRLVLPCKNLLGEVLLKLCSCPRCLCVL